MKYVIVPILQALWWLLSKIGRFIYWSVLYLMAVMIQMAALAWTFNADKSWAAVDFFLEDLMNPKVDWSESNEQYFIFKWMLFCVSFVVDCVIIAAIFHFIK